VGRGRMGGEGKWERGGTGLVGRAGLDSAENEAVAGGPGAGHDAELLVELAAHLRAARLGGRGRNRDQRRQGAAGSGGGRAARNGTSWCTSMRRRVEIASAEMASESFSSGSESVMVGA
jgi:hypothetical protein